MRICERRWFLSYGLGAKINSRDRFLREIAFLKKVKPSFMWRGDLVHGVIADVLQQARRGKTIPVDRASVLLEQRAKNQWLESMRRASSGDPRTSLQPEGPILMEHYYEALNNGLQLDEIISPARQQMMTLYKWIEHHGLLDEMRKTRDVWIEPSLFMPNSPGFSVNDVRFITKVDLALISSGFFRIYDWKTSLEPRGEFHLSHEHRQASYYALWPYFEMNFPVENIEIKVVYAGGDNPKAHEARLVHQDIEDLIADAELIIEATREFLDVDKGFILEDFDWATSGKACQWCPFQQICQRELI